MAFNCIRNVGTWMAAAALTACAAGVHSGPSAASGYALSGFSKRALARPACCCCRSHARYRHPQTSDEIVDVAGRRKARLALRF